MIENGYEVSVTAPLDGTWCTYTRYWIPDSRWNWLHLDQWTYLQHVIEDLQHRMVQHADVSELRWVVKRPLEWTLYPPTDSSS